MDITMKQEKASFWSVIKEFFSTSKENDENKEREIAEIIKQEDSKYIEKLEASQKILETTKRNKSKAKADLEIETEKVKVNKRKSTEKAIEVEQKEIGE